MATSLKHIEIDKATQTMVIVVGVAVFIVIFCLFSSKALISKLAYQNRVINAQHAASAKLTSDITSANNLFGSYENFVNTSQNIVGGNTSGSGNSDGSNAKIVLDALPSQYDYPALATSVQDLLQSQAVNIDSISGTDQEATISTASTPATTTTTATTTTAATPATTTAPVAMPISFSFDGPYQNIQNAVQVFEKSIRPVQVQTLSISGNQSDLTVDVTAQSYYQPQQNFTITTETIK